MAVFLHRPHKKPHRFLTGTKKIGFVCVYVCVSVGTSHMEAAVSDNTRRTRQRDVNFSSGSTFCVLWPNWLQHVETLTVFSLQL